MASQIESGINTYVGHFRQLIDVCIGFGTRYNPQTGALQIASLETQYTGVITAVNLVDSLLPDYITAESIRREKFGLMPPIALRVQATAVVLGLPEGVVTRIKEIVRKIRGERTHKIAPAPPNSEPEKHISVSQTSFNEQIGHFNQLIDLAVLQPAYTPAEEDLQEAALKTLLSEMRLANDAVMVSLPPLTAARQERDKLLYAPKTGMIDTALAVKEYVKAVFGYNSPEYREVNHIRFQNRKI